MFTSCQVHSPSPIIHFTYFSNIFWCLQTQQLAQKHRAEGSAEGHGLLKADHRAS